MLKEIFLLLVGASFAAFAHSQAKTANSERTRVIVNSDGEIDDECSMVRFLLYSNVFDIEGIITTSSQYHWHGHKWAGDDWLNAYLGAYDQVFPNLVKHDKNYPTPEHLRSVSFLGNIDLEGEMDKITPGSEQIVKVLLDESDDRPIWLQAWGGTNTIARALKTIEEKHPEKMAYVANKMRFFFIWEQDSTYQNYIRPHWGKFNIPTIISDQFISIMYYWKKTVPANEQKYFEASWIKQNIMEGHGALCSLYKAHKAGDTGFVEGDFRSEGDSPSFLHNVETGLRNMESPDWGGWGGRYVKIRENTWLDSVADPSYRYPDGRWWGNSAWGRERLRKDIPNDTMLLEYLRPIWRWAPAFQNDFAARADWCVKSYREANHPPVVKLLNPLNMNARPGEKLKLSAKGSYDPDGDKLNFKWWQYGEADSYEGKVELKHARKNEASFLVPTNIRQGDTIHIVCEVSDNGSPSLTRYQRTVITIKESAEN